MRGSALSGFYFVGPKSWALGFGVLKIAGRRPSEYFSKQQGCKACDFTPQTLNPNSKLVRQREEVELLHHPSIHVIPFSFPFT